MPRLTSIERPGTMRYRRLANPGQDIRLLEILPARTPEDAIVARLMTTSLDKFDSDIHALSSLIGDPEVTETLYVDGKAVSISAHQAAGLKAVRNLFASSSRSQRKSWPSSISDKTQGSGKLGLSHRLLNFLGIPTHALYVWLDSICVNMNDEDEKIYLKETMKKVYSAAKIVGGWLGPAKEHTEAGVSTFRQIDEAMPPFWGDPGDKDLHPENYAPTHKWFTSISDSLLKDGDDGIVAFMRPHWIGANDFMHRPFLQRQWILQEFFMASNPAFMIGEHMIAWRTILRINRMLEEFKDNESDTFPSQFRPAIAALPLGTIYELLEEIMRRQQRIRSVPDMEANSHEIFPYQAFDPEEKPDSVVINKEQLKS